MDIKGDFLRKTCREGSGRFDFAGSKMVIAAMAAAAVTQHAEQVPVVRMHIALALQIFWPSMILFGCWETSRMQVRSRSTRIPLWD